MSKKVSTKIFSAIMVMALAVSANVSGYMGGFDDDRAHVNLNVGSKMINPGDKFGNDVKDMKSQTQFGLDLDYKFDVLPFHIAVGYHASSSEKGISTLSLSEIRLGARKYQDFDAFSIYYGGGLSSVSAKLEKDKYLVTAAVAEVTALEATQSLSQYEASTFFTTDYKAAVVTALNGASGGTVTAVSNASTVAELDTAIGNLADGIDSVTTAMINDITPLKDQYGDGGTTYVQEVLTARSAVAAVYSEAASETASTLGFYGEVGGLYNVTEAIYVGANVTYTSATVEFEKVSTKKEKMDVGGAQIGLVVGYAF